MAGGTKRASGRRPTLPGCFLRAAVLWVLLPLPLDAADGDVIPLKETHLYKKNSSQKFCYTNEMTPKWHDIWTRIQIRVKSTKMIRVFQVENEEKLKELEEFNIWNYIGSFFKEKLNDTYISVGLYSYKTCLKVDPLEQSSDYSITVARTFDPKLFVVTFLGLLLFFCSDLMSSPQFPCDQEEIGPPLESVLPQDHLNLNLSKHLKMQGCASKWLLFLSCMIFNIFA